MKILNSAIAGTLESSDAQVMVEPADAGLTLAVESIVMNQYGRQIKEAALKTLNRMGITNGNVKIIDKGALECTLVARIECAVYRSLDQSEKNIPWEVM